MSAFPDVKCLQMTSDFEFVVLACDGIWDVMTSQEVVSFVHKNVYDDKYP